MRRANFWLVVAVAIWNLPGLTLDAASAATQVSGGKDDLQVKVQNASIKEVFDAMSAKFGIRYKLPHNIGVDGDLTGVYSGSLSQVLARILDGKDYVLEITNRDFKVIVFRSSGATVQHSASQPVAVSASAVPSKASKPVAAQSPSLPSSNPAPPPLSTYVSAN